MKKTRVLLDFVKLAIAEKIAFYRNVISKLTGNAAYPNPDVALAEAKTSVDKLENLFLASRDGSHSIISAMHAAEDETDDLFRILAAYVSRIANGDEALILSSGFDYMKQPAAKQKDILAVENGDVSGSVFLVARAVDKAGSYIWQMAKDVLPPDEEGWKKVGYSTQASFGVANLTVGATYYFRFAAVTPDGTTDFCTPVLKIVI